MALFNLFKIPRYRSFDIQPRYYDPEAEERDKRFEKIRNQMKEETTSEYKPNISFRRTKYYEERKKVGAQSTIRIIIIAAILAAITYFMVFNFNLLNV